MHHTINTAFIIWKTYDMQMLVDFLIHFLFWKISKRKILFLIHLFDFKNISTAKNYYVKKSILVQWTPYYDFSGFVMQQLKRH